MSVCFSLSISAIAVRSRPYSSGVKDERARTSNASTTATDLLSITFSFATFCGVEGDYSRPQQPCCGGQVFWSGLRPSGHPPRPMPLATPGGRAGRARESMQPEGKGWVVFRDHRDHLAVNHPPGHRAFRDRHVQESRPVEVIHPVAVLKR